MSYRRLLACLLTLALFLSSVDAGLIHPGYAESIQNMQESSEMQEGGETTVPTAQPEPSPEVFLYGEGASYSVQVMGVPLSAGVELTVRLEYRLADNSWTAVEKPGKPGEDYSLILLMNQTGEAQAVFPLEGMPSDRAYRVRAQSGHTAGGQDLSYTAAYSDRQLREDSFATLISLEIAAADPSVSPPAEPAQTSTPEESAAPETGIAQTPEFADPSAGITPVPDTADTPVPEVSSATETPVPDWAVTPAPEVSSATETPAPDTTQVPESYTQFESTMPEIESTPSPEPMMQLPRMMALTNDQDGLGFSASGMEALTAADDYVLTLDLTLNGEEPVEFPLGFSVTKDEVSGEITCDLNSYNAGIASVSSDVKDGLVVLTLGPDIPEGDPSLVYTVTVNPDTGEYGITASANGYSSVIVGSSGTFASGSAQASITAIALIDYMANVNWNDNKAGSRPVPVVTLKAGSDPVQPQPEPEIQTLSYNLVRYTYADLPKYDHGNPVAYSFSQESLAGYITSEDGNTIINTLKTSLAVYMQWCDASTKTLTRPIAADWLNYLTLKRQSRKPGASLETVSPAGYGNDFTGDTWTLTVNDIPAYDPQGYPYDYSIVESPVVSLDAGLGTYVQTVKNAGIYGDETAPDTVYNGGTLINTITDLIGFAFDKHWKDDGETAGRPQVKFYLYRFPENNGLDFDTLAPVKGHDSMLLSDSGSDDVHVVYAADGTLPRYDLKGNEYVYYIREVMTNPGDYKTIIQNASSPITNYILPGADVVNIREATISVPFTKVWQAKAVQSMNGGITVELARKLASQDDTAWAYVSDTTLTGFRAETMTMTSQFGGCPKYDENGAAYMYRVREIGATINAEGGQVPDDNISDNRFTQGEFDFDVIQPAPDDNTNTIVNKLVGTTKLRVKKLWQPGLPDGTASAITVRILQDGLTSWEADSITYPAGVSRVSGATFNISGEGDLDVVFESLPRYDIEGREYTYTVDETAILQPEDYWLADISYSIDESSVKTGTIVNAHGSGQGLRFEVEKIWLDDGDLLSRVPVTMGLFYKDGTEPLTQIILTAAGTWHGRIDYTPEGEQSSNYSDYFIREIDSEVFTIDGNYNAYLASGTGNARNIHHKYIVTTNVSDGYTRYTITNLRTGRLKITIDKRWMVNGLNKTDLSAVFELYKGPVLADSQALPMSGGSIVFGGETGGLEKYDQTGAIIPYRVKEAGLNGLGEAYAAFTDGHIAVAIDEFILSSAVPGLYRFGATLNDPDEMSYTFSNTLTGSGEITINKIWRDPGTGIPIRPDIRLFLYRYTDEEGGAVELVATTRLWNTSHEENEWFWTCSFGSYPKFDANGSRYHYYVRETILQASEYAASYFSEMGGTNMQPDPAGTTSEETFEKQPGEVGTYAYASFDSSKTGTIINTLKGSRDVERKKIWLNLPAWFNQTDLPDVCFRLYRSLEPVTEATVGQAVELEGAPWIVTLFNGSANAVFDDAPVYDDYGNRYYYYVEELDAGDKLSPFQLSGYQSNNNKAAGNVTNTYNLTTPGVDIKVTKSWSFDAADSEQIWYPDVTFDLYQTWTSGSHIRDAKVNTVTIPGGKISDLKDARSTQTYTFTKDESGSRLLRYAPDGQEYGYYVLEKPLDGYSVLPAYGKAEVNAWDVEHTTGDAAFQNAYVPQDKTSILATKIWSDQNDTFGTRPLFDQEHMPLAFTLMRRTPSGGSEAVSATTEWTMGTDADASKWFCTFTGIFPTYSTLGQRYTYYVTETLNAPYDSHYRLTSGSGTLTITNSLRTVNVLATKSFTGTDGTPLDDDTLDHLNELGAMPQNVTFTVLSSANDGSDWAAVSGITKTVTWTELKYAALHGSYITIAQNLPMYVQHTAVPYKYWTQETLVNMAGADMTPAAAGFAADNPAPADSNTISAIVNKLQLRKLYFVKNWDDENDRDGVRPGSIVYTIVKDADKTTTVTLTGSTDSSDPSEDAGHPTAANRWRAELIVPLSGTYSVTEEEPGTGYTQDAERALTAQDELLRTNWWSFTNKRDKELISITATKAWAGDSAWVEKTRPSSVALRLQYRDSDMGNWVDLKDSTVSPDPLIPVGSAAEITLTPATADAWNTVSAFWDHLPAYIVKASSTQETIPCQYRVVESVPNGYTGSYSTAVIYGNTAEPRDNGTNSITVTNTLITVSLKGKKTWSDNNNRYNTRPGSITLTLHADGVPMDPQPSITWNTGSNPWTYSYTGLPRYRKGTTEPVVYSVSETPAAGYTPSATGAVFGTIDANGNVTNADFTNTLITVTITGKKTWIDDGDRYGKRPAGITLTVKAGAVNLSPQPTISWVKTGNPWTYTISGLPKYQAGTEVPALYSVQETAVLGYTPATDTIVSGTLDAGGNVTGADFENTLVTVSLSGSKSWIDQADLYGMRPGSITLTVLADTVPMSPQPVLTWDKTGDVWTYSMTGLPRYKKASTVTSVYTVRETAVKGYTPNTDTTRGGTSDAGGNVTGVDFANTLATISVSGMKNWNDASDRYQRRPGGVSLTLNADGSALMPQPDPVWDKTTDTDHWTYSYTNLPRYKKNTTTPIVYSVSEASVVEYTSNAPVTGTLDGNGNVTGANITNTLITVSVSGTKTWADNNNLYSTRPGSITLTLNEDGVPMNPQPSIAWDKAANSWTYSFSGLPRYRKGTTDSVVYSVTETPAAGYTPSTTGAVTGTVNGTNGNVADADFTNSLDTVTVSGAKNWIDDSNHYGMRPDIVILTILADGGELSPQPDPEWDKTTDTDRWTYEYTELPRYQKGTLTPIVYSVLETPADGYAPETFDPVTGAADPDGNVTDADLTNTLISVTVSGTKTWIDDSDYFGMRPDSVALTLLADDEELSPQPDPLWDKTTDTDHWTYKYTNLPRYHKGTQIPIVYSVLEAPATGYTLGTEDPVAGMLDTNGYVTQADFTNTLISVSVSGSKTWMDDSDHYGMRPDGIVLTLLADGEELSPQPVPTWDTAAGQDRWAYEYSGLPRYQKGTLTPIAYSVAESAPGGYAPDTLSPVTGVLDADGSMADTDFTNTLITVSLTGSKTWADHSDHYGMRPGSVKLTLLADGAELTPQPDPVWDKVTDPDRWTFGYTDLPRYQKGTAAPVTYSVLETPVYGYVPGTLGPVTGVADSNGNVADVSLTNTLITVSVSGTKNWLDDSDRYATRPESIILTLQADGVIMDPQPAISLSKNGNAWTYAYADLPRYRKGSLYPVIYSVLETPVPGYTPGTTDSVTGTVGGDGNVTGADFTNTLQTVFISGKKTWLDDNDRYGMRPQSITLTVLTGGTVLSPQPSVLWVKNKSEWSYSIEGLPRYKAGTTTHEAYSVRETATEGYAPGSDTTVSGTLDNFGNIKNADFENTLITVTLSGSKSWLDDSNKYGTRPGSILLTVMAGSAAMTPQPDPVWDKAAGSDRWTYKYTGLPRYQKGTLTPVRYSVTESPSKGYKQGSPASVKGTLDSDGNVTGVDFTNSLITISVSGKKNWLDQSDRFGIRPDSIGLTLLAGGEIMASQTEPVWDKTTKADTWAYTYSGLPRFKPGTEEPIVYTVREMPVNGYLQAEDQTGAADASGNVMISDLDNILIRRLMIDNITVNPASKATDAGGFVAVNGSPNSQRDASSYQDNEVVVAWRAEENWRRSARITVRYLGFGKDQSNGWNSVTISTDGIEALRSIPYFAEATLTENNGTAILQLANDPDDMPYMTEVLVDFSPTLAVENTTRKDAGGEVSIETASVTADGRYPSVIAYGKAAKGYSIDLRNLQLSLPRGVRGTVQENTDAVPIKPAAGGQFTSEISVMLAGKETKITVTGTVEVLKRDSDRYPIKVAVTLNDLPVSLDIGIPFARTGSIPVTGDPIVWIMAAFALSGLAMVLFRKKKSGHSPDKN